jgi:hypothetical protein
MGGERGAASLGYIGRSKLHSATSILPQKLITDAIHSRPALHPRFPLKIGVIPYFAHLSFAFSDGCNHDIRNPWIFDMPPKGVEGSQTQTQMASHGNTAIVS